MTRHFIFGLLISLFVVIADKPAAADGIPIVYDTVDAVQLRAGNIIRVTGIILGEGTPSVHDYSLIPASIASPDYAARCDRLALLAMSKPGKFQFTLALANSSQFYCSLIVRAP